MGSPIPFNGKMSRVIVNSHHLGGKNPVYVAIVGSHQLWSGHHGEHINPDSQPLHSVIDRCRNSHWIISWGRGKWCRWLRHYYTQDLDETDTDSGSDIVLASRMRPTPLFLLTNPHSSLLPPDSSCMWGCAAWYCFGRPVCGRWFFFFGFSDVESENSFATPVARRSGVSSVTTWSLAVSVSRPAKRRLMAPLGDNEE